jgi:hypothetical protein
MTIRYRAALLWPLLTLFLLSCSDPVKEAAAKKAAEKPEPVTGRTAIYRMYSVARTWAMDAQPIELQSYNLQQVKSSGGKAGAWTAVWVSPAQGKARPYTYSVAEAEGNLHEGVFGGPEESFSGRRGQSLPFLLAALKIDSDEAYQTAMKQKPTIAFVEKNPNLPLTFLVEKTSRFPDPTWRVIWGESVGTSEYSVFADATTGRFLEDVR